jgi:LPXTG-motif cell wall-anchored protein
VFATMTTAINFVLLLVGAFLILWSLVLRRKKQKAAVA